MERGSAADRGDPPSRGARQLATLHGPEGNNDAGAVEADYILLRHCQETGGDLTALVPGQANGGRDSLRTASASEAALRRVELCWNLGDAVIRRRSVLAC